MGRDREGRAVVTARGDGDVAHHRDEVRVWLADRTCRWACACACHTPRAAQPKEGQS
ncbi:hypothetical protein SAMN05421505_120108 [Sinosporangium album]|uniref:Uncharacterized protein n=1 Tax=Sinosporangium album TaxID=504805 RepID=A0A1G8EI02_9ACTN|nr:hypothetical protein [Sinosporangium album]SDH69462.1 hypothetical protein SAMN05421505_120108 [Sinosporangium album]